MKVKRNVTLINSRITISVFSQYFSISESIVPDLCLGTGQPLYWQKPVYELDVYDATNNGFINDDLIIWMREAAFPNFKKLYGVLYRASDPFTNGLPVGNYSIEISYSILFTAIRDAFFMGTLAWVKVAYTCPIICICFLLSYLLSNS